MHEYESNLYEFKVMIAVVPNLRITNKNISRIKK